MTSPTPDLVAADLARLINPGLRSPRAGLAVLPNLALVQADIHAGGRSVADAIESVVNRGLAAMAAESPDARLPRLAADPVKALRAALALRPGSERVKSKTRRTAAAQALGLLSGDGWRAHHEKPLLRDLADVICALETDSGDVAPQDIPQGANRRVVATGLARQCPAAILRREGWQGADGLGVALRGPPLAGLERRVGGVGLRGALRRLDPEDLEVGQRSAELLLGERVGLLQLTQHGIQFQAQPALLGVSAQE